MPRATVSHEGHRRDLEELPEGYVILRKLSYGEILHRRGLGMGVNAPFKKDTQEVDFKLEMNTEELRFFEFSMMILEHNLEDAEGKLLDMKNRKDVSSLDPKVAQEIEKHIMELNMPDDETPLPETSGSPSVTANA
jgi:hypothetical protein